MSLLERPQLRPYLAAGPEDHERSHYLIWDQLRLSDRAQLFRAVADYLRPMDLVPDRHQSDEKFVVGLAALLGSGNRE